MPPLSSISTTFNDVSYPLSPSVLHHPQGHGDVYSHFQLSTSDCSSHGRLLPQQAYPHSSPAMQSDHSHPQQPSHIHANNSFWAMNALAAHHSYGQVQPSTSPTSLALLHGTFYDTQHHQALVHAQEQAQAHYSTGGTLSALHQSPLDIQHLSLGNKILPRTTNIPAANAFGGVASAGVSGSLDPETGIFLRTVEHPRLRTAQACEKCRIRKAKCSGEQPNCKRCISRGLICEYAPERKMRGPNKPKPPPAPTSPASNGSPTSATKSSFVEKLDSAASFRRKNSPAQPSRKRAATLSALPVHSREPNVSHFRRSSLAKESSITTAHTSSPMSDSMVVDSNIVTATGPLENAAEAYPGGRIRSVTSLEARPSGLRGRPRPPPLDFSNVNFNPFPTTADTMKKTVTVLDANNSASQGHFQLQYQPHPQPQLQALWNCRPDEYHGGHFGNSTAAAEIYGSRRTSQPNVSFSNLERHHEVGRARAASEVSHMHLPLPMLPNAHGWSFTEDPIDDMYLHQPFSADSYRFPHDSNPMQHHHYDAVSTSHARSSSTSGSIPSDPSPITPHSLLDQFPPNSASSDHDIAMLTCQSYGNGQEFDGDFDGGLRLEAVNMGYHVGGNRRMDGDSPKSGEMSY